MLFLLPEVLIVLLIIGLAYLPPVAIYYILAYTSICILLHRYWDVIIQKIETCVAKIKNWRRKEND